MLEREIASPLTSFQITLRLVAFSGESVAVSVKESPMMRCFCVVFSEIACTKRGFTTTLHSAVMPLPSAASARTRASPTFFAWMTPSAESAIALPLTSFQITLRLVAFSGESVVVSVKVSPTMSSFCVALREIACTKRGFTTTLHSAVMPLPSTASARTRASPTFFAWMTPSAESAIALPLTSFQITLRLVAFSGESVAVSVKESPMMRFFCVALSEIACTKRGFTTTLHSAVMPLPSAASARTRASPTC